MFERILAFVLVAIMMLSIAACGNKGSDSGNNKVNSELSNGTASITDGFVLKNDESIELGEPAGKLDPKEIYSKIEYVPEMFYGDYSIIGRDEAEQAFAAESEYFTWTKQGTERSYTVLPFRMEAGLHTLAHRVNSIEEYNWARLYFMCQYDEDYYAMDTLLCAYEVDGNKIIFNPLDTFNVDDETKTITYTLTDVFWEYDFEFNGRHLTLSKGDSSVTLTCGLDPYHETDYFYVDNYLTAGTKSFENIDEIIFRYDPEDGSSIYFATTDDESSYNSIGVLQENGLFTFTLSLEESAKTYQLVYFYCRDDGLILTDGTEIYYYTHDYSDRSKSHLDKYLTEDLATQLEDMTETELETIVEKTENLLEDLSVAYEEAGLSVDVNSQTGEIALDSTVLFGVDESAVSDEGKAFLKQFMNVYTSVVFSDKYENFVSKIMVEGHTDTNGSYEHNKTLSQARADSVKEYCLSAECGVDAAYAELLSAMLEAVGYSYDKPIYDENGEVNMDASRRVSFRFIINLEK